MLSGWMLLLISAGYAALLFAIASWGDWRARRRLEDPPQPWIYSLALAVYCTSWTFYGAVGRAAERGWDFLPIYLGPILVLMLGAPLIARLIRVCKRHNLTSLADFIGARYGRRQSLAAGVTLIAVVGVLPYLALQLKAVASTVSVLSSSDAQLGGWLGDGALVTAALLAVFGILFGTREVSSSENHHGLVLAVAFESVVKLVAFVVVGLISAYVVFDGIGDATAYALSRPPVRAAMADPTWMSGFLAQTVLAMAAMLCLPRQFQVLVVENTAVDDLKTARWVFPAYLVVISLFVLPIAAAGAYLLPATVVPDTYVLNVPMALDHPWIALFAYIGGFSAATSMVIVSSIALSTMLSNEVVTPLLLRWQPLGIGRGPDLSTLIKRVRRFCIVLLLVLAYLYTRFFIGDGSLASIGLLSFAAVLQFAPALVGGLYWKRGTHAGVVAGLVIGFALWCYTLLLPAAAGPAAAWVTDGPWGIGGLRPHALLGITGFDPVTHGTVVSLLGNLLGYVMGSALTAPGLRDHLHAVRFIGHLDLPPPVRPRLVGSNATVEDLQTLLERFFGPQRARQLLDEYGRDSGHPLSPRDRAPADWVRYCERLLAGVLGASSARVVMAAMLRGRDMQVEDVIRLLDETSHVIQFSRELTQAALEHLSQGVSVVDRELRLVAWNRRYAELFQYPEALLVQGQPIETLIRYNGRHGLLAGEGDAEDQVQRRLEHLRAGRAYEHERQMPDGSVIQIRGNPMPGGGFVTSYADVSAYKHAEARLQELAGSLEQRVRERTEELSTVNDQVVAAKAEAERANSAKTRFLAAASHDLVQPISAAKLFLSAFDPAQATPERFSNLQRNVEGALSAAEQLLSGLLDISRLEAGATEVQREDLALTDLLVPLANEFGALAQDSGIDLRAVPSRAVVYSDPALLRRVLQNFLSNACRYTERGRVLLGVRRRGAGALRIEVHDTGPGIPTARQREVFEEFRRLRRADGRGGGGLGLGLAIAERTARLLGHRLGLYSVEGRGSCFWIEVPRGQADRVRPPPVTRELEDPLTQSPSVLVIDNEPTVLEGMRALLERWGCTVTTAANEAEARHALRPAVVMADYHLDDEVSGIEVLDRLQARWGGDPVPAIVITADHTPQARKAAAASGYAYLQKPVPLGRLRALINRLAGTS